MNRWGLSLSTGCRVIAFLMLKTGSFLLCFYTGKHPVCGEPLFCFSANPDSLSKLCGFHIDHRSRSFLLQVSGVSSRLSFCCTSLVSGFIIHDKGGVVYSQSVQQMRRIFAPKIQKTGIHQLHQNVRAVCGKKRETDGGLLCAAKICAIIAGNEW